MVIIYGNGPYGIAIGASATGNLVTSVEAMNKQSADLIDLSQCGSSAWFGNQFANATPAASTNRDSDETRRGGPRRPPQPRIALRANFRLNLQSPI
jgi:hypothetical protein